MLCCNVQDVNLLAGPGKGVILIKVDANDEVMGVFPATVPVVLHRSTGGKHKLTGSERQPTSRGGKGRAITSRGTIKRIEFPPPELAELEPEDGKK
jgi:DNA gyrase subunit A